MCTTWAALSEAAEKASERASETRRSGIDDMKDARIERPENSHFIS
jgi:hypothetical protein